MHTPPHSAAMPAAVTLDLMPFLEGMLAARWLLLAGALAGAVIAALLAW